MRAKFQRTATYFDPKKSINFDSRLKSAFLVKITILRPKKVENFAVFFSINLKKWFSEDRYVFYRFLSKVPVFFSGPQFVSGEIYHTFWFEMHKTAPRTNTTYTGAMGLCLNFKLDSVSFFVCFLAIFFYWPYFINL